MSNEVVTSITINGKIVVKTYQIDGYDVYEEEDDYESCRTLFFCKKNKVMFKMEISAECSQNTGFISGIDFTPCK